MGIQYTLNRFVFLNGVTGSAGGPVYSPVYACDYRFSGNQDRKFYVSAATADTVTIEASFDREVSALTAWWAVSSLSGQQAYQFSTDEPFVLLRARVNGAGGPCRVLGVV